MSAMLHRKGDFAADHKARRFDLLYRLLQSFYFALRGLLLCLYEERNLRIHLSASLWVLWLALRCHTPNGELAALAVCCGLVICGELFNSAVEATVDLLSPDYHPIARRAKDIAAAGVLAGAFFAVITGYIIFIRSGRLAALLPMTPLQAVVYLMVAAVTFLFIFYYPTIIRPLKAIKENHLD
ncbi:MAG: diacylglycerol kinase family protein [Angelakisella sp.]